MDPSIILQSVREIKNSIIGNKTKKKLFIQLGAISRLVDILDSDLGIDDQILIQTAAAIGSFACGEPFRDDVLMCFILVISGAVTFVRDIRR